MVDSATARTFTDSFMRSFSFVDDINSRRRRNRMLEEELEDRRRRADRRERLEDEDRAFLNEERGRSANLRRRMEEVNRLLADPNVDLDRLTVYSDIPAVSQFLRGEREDLQTMDDLRLIVQGELTGQPAQGLASGVAGAGAGQAAPGASAPAGGLNQQVGGLELPADRFAAPPSTDKTTLDLERMADQDPQAAMAARRQRNVDKSQAAGSVPLEEQAAIRVGGVPVLPPTPEQRAAESRNAGRDQLNKDWDLFLDIENPEGDPFRNLPAGTVVNQYFNDRNSISDPALQTALDKRMGPYINRTIDNAQKVLADPASAPQDQATARRHLNQSLALSNSMAAEYRPLKAAGIDARGLPNNNANPQLTENAIASGKASPGTPVPAPNGQQRADVAMVNRGTRSGRISERFAQAATRLYKGGRISEQQYISLMRTGQLPAAAPEIKSFNPEDDIAAIYPDGSVKILRHGRAKPLTAAQMKAKNQFASGRNILEDDALKHVQTLADAYNTDDDPTRGNALLTAFLGAVADNEQGLTERGRDMSNILDVNWAWNRFNQLFVFRDAFNDEMVYDGDFMPEFQDHFGSLSQAFLSEELDAAVESGEIGTGGFLGLGQTPVNVTQVPPVTTRPNRDPAVYDQIRAQYPQVYGTANTPESNARIEADLQAQERRGR